MDDLARVHIPFLLNDLSQITFVSEFQTISQSYTLTFRDIYMILNSSLPEKCQQVWDQARARADEIHQTNAVLPVGAEVVLTGP